MLSCEWNREAIREATYLEERQVGFSEDEWMIEAHMIGREVFRVPRREESDLGPEILDISEEEPMGRSLCDPDLSSCFDSRLEDQEIGKVTPDKDLDPVSSRQETSQFRHAFCLSSTLLEKSEHLVGTPAHEDDHIHSPTSATPSLVSIPAAIRSHHLEADSSPAHFAQSASMSDLE
jgi:hypothetical protein